MVGSMVEEMDSGGFRSLLERTIRVEDDDDSLDWSVHTIDYGEFKARLRAFVERRKQIRALLKASPNERLAEEVFNELLHGTKKSRLVDISVVPVTAAAATAATTKPRISIGEGLPTIGTATADALATYISLEEPGGSASSDMESVSSEAAAGKKTRSKGTIMRQLSVIERNEITLFLSKEHDKVVMFYVSQWQALSRRLERHQQANCYNRGSVDPDIGDEILELMAFCTINVITTHQILIRYDAFARAFDGTPMGNYYLKQVRRNPTAFRKILHHEEIEALADSYIAGNENSPPVINFSAQRFMFHDIINSLESNVALPMWANWNFCGRSSFVGLWKWYLVGLFEDRLGLEPAYLTERGRSLTKEMEQLAHWRAKKQEILRPKLEKKLTEMQRYHLTLNLLSGFLYCMNYYIIEPSSTMYVNRLGARDTMSGTLIGMMPLAAFISSIPYSIWTNHSFRNPMIMSSFTLVIGNLIYSFADVFRSFPMALCGRFVTGLGAPKCIIRRYMADTTPVSLRTGVNAGFGMVVAAGSAMGPAMAVLVSRMELTIWIPRFAYVTFNGLTLPGYVMAAFWLTFAVIVVATFEEPDREGLKEQKEMEEKADITTSSTWKSEYVPFRDGLLRGDVDGDSRFVTVLSGDCMDGGYCEDGAHRHLSGFFSMLAEIRRFLGLITLPVQLCLSLLFAKVFTIEALVSATSALTKNRYNWKVQQVGTLGFLNGLLVIPFSIWIGRLSLSYQDHQLMRWLVSVGCLGFFLLIDLSDLVATPTTSYNHGHVLAVTPTRYVIGYFMCYISIQAFEGVIGSTLSKVIPTALASGTFNSGLLATLVDTFGRACGDIFISMVGFVNLRQLMNLLFIPGLCIMLTSLALIERNRDILSV